MSWIYEFGFKKIIVVICTYIHISVSDYGRCSEIAQFALPITTGEC